MKQNRIMIRSLPEAMKVVKEMNLASQDEWAGDYRQAAREAISSFLTDRMALKLGFCCLAHYSNHSFSRYCDHCITN